MINLSAEAEPEIFATTKRIGTVLENVAYGLTVQKVRRAFRMEKAREWVRTVGLEGSENHYPA